MFLRYADACAGSGLKFFGTKAYSQLNRPRTELQFEQRHRFQRHHVALALLRAAQNGLGDRLHMRRTDRMRKLFNRVGKGGIHQRYEIRLKGSIGEVVHGAPQFCANVSGRLSTNGHEMEMFRPSMHVVWPTRCVPGNLAPARGRRQQSYRLFHPVFLAARLGVTPRT
jgi:hypothetical protein